LKNKTFYIVRHGETFASKNNVDYGEMQFSAEILDEGLPAIRKIGEFLKSVNNSKNYTSELLRCRQTSNIIYQISGKIFQPLDLLNEYLEPDFKTFKKRIQKLILTLEMDENEIFILCTHGAVISALKYLLTKRKYEIENLLDYPRTGTVLIIKNGKDKLMDFNL